MFGYITIDKENLTAEEYTVYKAIYCSLCKTMGKEYSLFSRFILSYDCTFFALLIMSIQDNVPCFNKNHCVFNPLKKCVLCENEVALSLSAALSISSAYYKLIDNINDSKSFKKIIYKCFLPVFRKWNNKVKVKYKEIDEYLSQMINNQFQVERDKTSNLDNACDPTASMLANVCTIIPKYIKSGILEKNIENSKRILYNFGYFLGRWIYLMDAIDDYYDDIRKNNFNPFILKFNSNFDYNTCQMTLNHSLSEMMLSYELLDKGKFSNIIANIIFKGLPKKQREVLDKHITNEEKLVYE